MADGAHEQQSYEVGTSDDGDMAVLGQIFSEINRAALSLAELAEQSNINDVVELGYAADGLMEGCLETIRKVRTANPELEVSFLMGAGELEDTEKPQTLVRI